MSPLQRLRFFWQDRQGLAAIEFALIAPVMMLIYFGLVEFCQAYMASRRAGHTASIVADMVAQGDVTSRHDLDTAFEIGNILIKPFQAEPLSIRITSVTMQANGQATVDWSRSKGTALSALDKNEPVLQFPTDIITTGETVIMGETEYTYVSGVTNVIRHPLTFKRSYYLRPRVSDKVTCKDC